MRTWVDLSASNRLALVIQGVGEWRNAARDVKAWADYIEADSLLSSYCELGEEVEALRTGLEILRGLRAQS